MTFFDPGELRDGNLRLTLSATVDEPATETRAPYYRFEMRNVITGDNAGRISFRLAYSEFFLLYAGQIGYSVRPEHRGNHYAARAMRLLMPLARIHGFTELWITCNPDNIASRRSCELAGAKLIEIIDVPSWTEMHQRGELQKCRYRLAL